MKVPVAKAVTDKFLRTYALKVQNQAHSAL